MATEVMLTVSEGGHVSGATASDAADLSPLAGGTYRAVLTSPRGRSPSQLALFWVMCGLIADNYPGGYSKEEVAQVIKIESGHANVIALADGTYVRTPKSIAFNAMTPDAFRGFLDKALLVAADKFGAGLADAARAELEKIGSA